MAVFKLSAEAKSLRDQYYVLKKSRNEGDVNMAILLTRLYREMGEESFWEFLYDKKEGFGMNGRTAGRARAMVATYKTVPQKTVWTAVGWRGVAHLRNIKKIDNLRSTIDSIMTIHKKLKRPLKDAEFGEVFDKFNKDLRERTIKSAAENRNRVYEERDLLIEAVHYAVKKHPGLRVAFKRKNPKILTIAGLSKASIMCKAS